MFGMDLCSGRAALPGVCPFRADPATRTTVASRPPEYGTYHALDNTPPTEATAVQMARRRERSASAGNGAWVSRAAPEKLWVPPAPGDGRAGRLGQARWTVTGPAIRVPTNEVEGVVIVTMQRCGRSASSTSWDSRSSTQTSRSGPSAVLCSGRWHPRHSGTPQLSWAPWRFFGRGSSISAAVIHRG